MEMVGHQTVRASFDVCGVEIQMKAFEKEAIVFLLEEYFLPTVAPIEEMVILASQVWNFSSRHLIRSIRDILFQAQLRKKSANIPSVAARIRPLL